MATQTKEEAIESVKDGNREYYDKYLSFAKEWVKTQFKPFNSECMKKAYFELGNAEPEQPNVIGAVFRYLSKEKLILYHSHTEAKNPAAHGA